jgi:hypothetical protein
LILPFADFRHSASVPAARLNEWIGLKPSVKLMTSPPISKHKPTFRYQSGLGERVGDLPFTLLHAVSN